ncbi:MAG: hypothetical protein CSA62_05115 [Planctomycetota bacterium]|nr:MAG: hypothetical protein CSA62_05115 [Planctomycetota bacterium]
MSLIGSALSLRSCTLLRASLVSAALLAAAPLATSQTPSGWQLKRMTLPTPAKGWSGLAQLPSGSLVSFDGQELIELDPKTGRRISALAKLSKAVFASDVVLAPDGRSVFFCESSSGAIYNVDLKSKAVRKVTTLGGCFKLGFNPLEGTRFLYVSALPGFTGDPKLFRVDIWSGLSKVIAKAPGYSGPFHFDQKGGLYFAPAPKKFGVPKLAKILHWSSAQVRTAIAGKTLEQKSARLFASQLDSVYDFVVDGQGTIYGSDASYGKSSLFELGKAGGKGAFTGLAKVKGLGVGSLLFAPGTRPFERFGSDGAVYALASNFKTKHELWSLTPARPQLSASSSNPAAKSRLTLSLSGAQKNSSLLWLLGDGLVPERAWLPLGLRGLCFPYFAIVPTSPFLALPAMSDAKGQAKLSFIVPGPSALRFTVQVFGGKVVGLPGGEAPSPWFTSKPVRILVK